MYEVSHLLIVLIVHIVIKNKTHYLFFYPLCCLYIYLNMTSKDHLHLLWAELTLCKWANL